MAERTLAEVFVAVRPDTRNTGRELERDLSKVDTRKAGDKAGHAYGQAFTGGAKRIIAGVGAVVAAAGIGRIAAQSVRGFQEHQKVVAQTNAVLKSTKGAANTSTAAIVALSDALERKTTVDGDVIQSGANMLATFTNISNGVGKGNKIFDRATATVLDMSVALGQDAPASAIQLGKALNDPITGVSALRKVGVTFTEQQQKQIEKMVKSGNLMGAQKVILAELNKEFGGSAKAQGDALGATGRLNVAWRQAQDTIGAALLPAVNGLAGVLADRLPGAADRTAKFIGLVRVGVKAMIGAFREGDVTSTGFIGKFEQVGVAAKHVHDWLQTVDFHTIAVQAGEFAQKLKGIDVRAIAEQLKGINGQQVGAGFRLAGAGLQFFADHIDTIIRFLPVLIGLFVAYQAAQAAGRAADVARLPIMAAGVLANFALARSNKSLAGAINTSTLSTGVNTTATITSRVVSLAAAAASKAWAGAQWLLNAALTANPIGLVIAALALLAVGIVIAWKRSETFRAVVTGAFKAVGDAGRALWDNVLRPYFKFIVDAWLTVAGAIVNGAATAFGWVPGIGPKLKAAAAAFNGFRDRVNTALGGVNDRKITVTATLGTVGAQEHTIVNGRVVNRATGGPVFGPGTATSDSIPAMLSAGEHVLTAREVKGLGGHSAVMDMRKAAVARGFAEGGPVGFDISPRLSGMARFEKALTAFNARVDGMARKLAAAGAAGTAGVTSAGLNGAVQFARSQQGKPYVWGSAGPGGYDCTGFLSALVNVAQGRSPYSRRFSTGTLPAGLFAPGHGAFDIGWFTGNPGHAGATVNGVPMESRGGDGVVVGSRSRGAGYSYFNQHGHLKGFARGGPVLPGDPPFDLLDPRGRHYRPGLLDALTSPRLFDRGGSLPARSATLAVNSTNHSETVTTGPTMAAVIAELQALRADLARMPDGVGRAVGTQLTKGGRR